MSAPRKTLSNGQELYTDEEIEFFRAELRRNIKAAQEARQRSGTARGVHPRVAAIAKIAQEG